MLQDAGISFDRHATDGIQELRFAELLVSSGLILNEDISWITFHGAFDFAYLLKSVTNAKLPDNLDKFNLQLKQYFPCVNDLKIIVQEVPDLKNGSLTKLGHELEVKRSGHQHQAGSDALLTSECFFEIKDKYFKTGLPRKVINKIYGLNQEYAQYTPTNNSQFAQAGQIDKNSMNVPGNQYPIFPAYGQAPANPYYVDNFQSFYYQNQFDNTQFQMYGQGQPQAPMMSLNSPYKLSK